MSNSNDDNLIIFEIPTFNMAELHKEFNKLNHRAAKLGCPPLEIIEHETVDRIDPHYIRKVSDGVMLESEAPKITMVRISVEGDAPKLAGYKFVGTLDHVILPGSVIVKTVPGQVVPQEFYKHDAWCDHCGKIRNRNQTFVLYNETENIHTQVGRQCLKDFLGHDPNAIARYLSAVWRLVETLEDPDNERWYGGYNREVWGFSHEKILELTISAIRTFGWIPRSAADPIMGRNATANEVITAMLPPLCKSDREEQQKLLDRLIRDDNDAEEAKAAMNWLKEQDNNNEYMHNLHSIMEATSVPVSMFGFWCSLAAAYQRAQERLEINKAQQKVNEYVGTIKDRLEFDVTVIGISYLDSAFGVTKLHRMIDVDGHTLVWFASTDTTMYQGGKFRIKGTIKDHSKYKDWKQTKLSRVAVLEEVTSS